MSEVLQIKIYMCIHKYVNIRRHTGHLFEFENDKIIAQKQKKSVNMLKVILLR